MKYKRLTKNGLKFKGPIEIHLNMNGRDDILWLNSCIPSHSWLHAILIWIMKSYTWDKFFKIKRTNLYILQTCVIIKTTQNSSLKKNIQYNFYFPRSVNFWNSDKLDDQNATRIHGKKVKSVVKFSCIETWETTAGWNSNEGKETWTQQCLNSGRL